MEQVGEDDFEAHIWLVSIFFISVSNAHSPIPTCTQTLEHWKKCPKMAQEETKPRFCNNTRICRKGTYLKNNLTYLFSWKEAYNYKLCILKICLENGTCWLTCDRCVCMVQKEIFWFVPWCLVLWMNWYGSTYTFCSDSRANVCQTSSAVMLALGLKLAGSQSCTSISIPLPKALFFVFVLGGSGGRGGVFQ